MDFDYRKNLLLFDSGNEIDSLNNLKKRITSIKNELKKEIGIKKLKAAVKYGFEKKFGFEFINGTLSDEEMLLAKKLLEEKYKADEWTYKLLTICNH